ncbi:MAG: TetR family transcriptional regulator [Pseudomonadota bacterium]
MNFIAKTPRSRRQQRKLDNHQRLIDATIDLIAEGGISAVTVSRVVERAGVSRGLINLHFETKDGLLTETLIALNREWEEVYEALMAEDYAHPAERLLAIVLMSYRPPIFDTKKNSAWHCFYADPRFRDFYQQHCFASDQEFLEVVGGLCDRLNAEGDYGLGPGMEIARSLRALTGGLWLELLTEPDHFDLDEAIRICRSTLNRFFPDHIPAEPPVQS